VQLLRANGCRVLGIDLDSTRVKQALDQGAEWGAAPGALPPGWSDAVTGGLGADLALVAASAADAAPLLLAAELCRPKGRIAVVGAMPLELDRRTFYEKELELRMSMSYGPGRYDRRYEELGLEYPLPYVRWTENRNLQSFLALVADGSVRPDRLDAQTVSFEEAVGAYEQLARGERRSLAVVFRYAETPAAARTIALAPPRATARPGDVGVAFLGAGNYAKSVLLPALESARGVRRVTLVTATGPSARRTAEKFGFSSCGTEAGTALADPSVGLVFVTTRHDSHARLAVDALRASKAVWLEKPVGLSEAEVDAVSRAVEETGGFLAVGYNRRFSPHARAAREALAGRSGPLAVHYAVAAGPPPRGTWVTDPREGGGRIVGEACHFVDLCTYLVGSPPANVFARALGRDLDADDSMVAVLGFPDGSTATLEYLARASAELPKERFEASADNCTVQCDNYRLTRILRGGRTRRVRTLNQDKGQRAAVREVIEAVREGRPSPFSLADVEAVSRATFAMLASARSGLCVALAPRRAGAEAS
jgi:polar amino acid transport system substrate-binding protein